ncbi:hypothetical protein SprV_0100036400 [Sparganum proliferum]
MPRWRASTAYQRSTRRECRYAPSSPYVVPQPLGGKSGSSSDFFLTNNSEWTVKSAKEFLTRMKHVEAEADEVMVSFDVISLFTSIPPALAINTIDGFLREKYNEIDQQLKRAHIIELLELCPKTFFTFNGQAYEQKKGTPMGWPLSGLIAEAVLQRLEQLVFISHLPKFWTSYFDDTFVVIKRSEVKAFKTLLNSIFPDIQFTMEEEVNNQLPFLGVQVTRLTDGKIRTTVNRPGSQDHRTTPTRGIRRNGNRLGQAQIIQLLKFCLKTYFTFDDTIYEQVKGTPMGSPILGLIAEAVLQRLESLVFRHHRPKFWARYVDDIFVVIKRDQVLTFKEHLNAIFLDIQFTMEEEENNQLSFLDVLVCRKDCGGLKIKVFRKATNMTQILNFNSSHPISHKCSCVRALYRRVETHCSEMEDKVAELQYL